MDVNTSAFCAVQRCLILDYSELRNRVAVIKLEVNNKGIYCVGTVGNKLFL